MFWQACFRTVLKVTTAAYFREYRLKFVVWSFSFSASPFSLKYLLYSSVSSSASTSSSSGLGSRPVRHACLGDAAASRLVVVVCSVCRLPSAAVRPL